MAAVRKHSTSKMACGKKSCPRRNSSRKDCSPIARGEWREKGVIRGYDRARTGLVIATHSEANITSVNQGQLCSQRCMVFEAGVTIVEVRIEQPRAFPGLNARR